MGALGTPPGALHRNFEENGASRTKDRYSGWAPCGASCPCGQAAPSVSEHIREALRPHTARRRLLTTTGYFNIGLPIQLELKHGAGLRSFRPLFCSRNVGVEQNFTARGCIHSNVIARVL